MADFEVTVNGVAYATRGEAIAAVDAAREEWKRANRDERIDGDKADYLQWKAANRPDDDAWDGTTPEEKAVYAEVHDVNLEAALAAREPVAAE